MCLRGSLALGTIWRNSQKFSCRWERSKVRHIKPYILRRRKCKTRKIHNFCHNLKCVKLWMGKCEPIIWSLPFTIYHGSNCNKKLQTFLYFSIALKKWQTPEFLTHHCWWGPQHIRTYDSNCHPLEAWSVVVAL